MKFDNPIDAQEWAAVTNGIIKAFEGRGYGIYELGPGAMMFSSAAMIEEFIQFGRAEDVLEVGMRYMLLPLVKDSKDSFQVFRAVDEMIKQVRAPYFFNCKQSADKSVEVLSKHLIDSIAIEPPFLEMSADVRFGPVMQENTVEIPLADAATVVKNQVMLALRGNKVAEVEKGANMFAGIGLTRKVEV